jgi:uncharacterized protein YjbJ (UPF0337 family)
MLPKGNLRLKSQDGGVWTVDAPSDETLGRVKEDAGALVGDDQLEQEGKLDEVRTATKGKAIEAAERLHEVIAHAKENAAQTGIDRRNITKGARCVA